MRIFVAGWQALTDIELTPMLGRLARAEGDDDPLIEGSVIWFWIKAIRELGHEARFFDHAWPRLLRRETLAADASLYEDMIRARSGDSGIATDDAAIMRGSLIEAARAFRPQLILTHQAERLDDATLDALGRVAPTATWVGVDPSAASRHDWMRSLFRYDTVFCAVESVRARLEAAGRRTRFLSFAFDPDLHRPTGARRDFDIGMVGTHKFPRRRILRRLATSLPGARIGIWGRRWPSDPILAPLIQGPAWHKEVSEAIGRMRIHLNIPQVTAEEDINMRCFETAGAGTALFSRRQESLARHFEIGREVVAWDSVEDLVEKCRHYLAHPEELGRIGEAGRKRALGEYTYRHRITRILEEMKGR